MHCPTREGRGRSLPVAHSVGKHRVLSFYPDHGRATGPIPERYGTLRRDRRSAVWLRVKLGAQREVVVTGLGLAVPRRAVS